MNVLSLVSYHFLPAKMGGQKGIALFNNFFRKKVNLTCVTTKSNDASLEHYKVLPILSNSQLRYVNIFYFFTLKKIIKQHQISHLIVEHPYYGWLGILLQKCCGVKLVIHSHNIESLRFKSLHKWWWKILWYYEKTIHKNADYNFFITNIDKEYAIEKYQLNSNKCTVITYGFELTEIPTLQQKNSASVNIRKKYNINEEEKILLFNGTLNYQANLTALDIILTKINPLLLQQNTLKYKIIICGKNLPDDYNNLLEYKTKNLIYAGFVNDITEYYLAANIFINPVNDGGGIKTKIVEALGYNVSLVTTQSGAIGISKNIVGDKMIVIENQDWQGFANAICTIDIHSNILNTYYQYFYWDNIATKAATALSSIIR